jgi:hypothetical protein
MHCQSIEAIVTEWIGELAAKGFEPDDPLFPATKVAPAANRGRSRCTDRQKSLTR